MPVAVVVRVATDNGAVRASLRVLRATVLRARIKLAISRGVTPDIAPIRALVRVRRARVFRARERADEQQHSQGPEDHVGKSGRHHSSLAPVQSATQETYRTGVGAPTIPTSAFGDKLIMDVYYA